MALIALCVMVLCFAALVFWAYDNLRISQGRSRIHIHKYRVCYDQHVNIYEECIVCRKVKIPSQE